MAGCQLQSCWTEVMASSGFTARRAAVEAFNGGSRYRKRGLAAMPTKFGISFTAVHLNQAGALVHIYTDGTILVTHGGGGGRGRKGGGEGGLLLRAGSSPA
jgi:xanthine dehydrogenase/oxidase